MQLAKFIAERTGIDFRSTAYVPCASCFAHCLREGTPGEPCWGRVLFEPDYAKVRRHYCSGHENPEQYRPKP